MGKGKQVVIPDNLNSDIIHSLYFSLLIAVSTLPQYHYFYLQHLLTRAFDQDLSMEANQRRTVSLQYANHMTTLPFFLILLFVEIVLYENISTSGTDICNAKLTNIS